MRGFNWAVSNCLKVQKTHIFQLFWTPWTPKLLHFNRLRFHYNCKQLYFNCLQNQNNYKQLFCNCLHLYKIYKTILQQLCMFTLHVFNIRLQCVYMCFGSVEVFTSCLQVVTNWVDIGWFTMHSQIIFAWYAWIGVGLLPRVSTECSGGMVGLGSAGRDPLEKYVRYVFRHIHV